MKTLCLPSPEELRSALAQRDDTELFQVTRRGERQPLLPNDPYPRPTRIANADEANAFYLQRAESVFELVDEAGTIGLVARFHDGWKAWWNEDAYPQLAELLDERFYTYQDAAGALCWLDNFVLTPFKDELLQWMKATICALAAASVLDRRDELHALAHEGANQLDQIEASSFERSEVTRWVHSATMALAGLEQTHLAEQGQCFTNRMVFG